jgi:hypothetical protein
MIRIIFAIIVMVAIVVQVVSAQRKPVSSWAKSVISPRYQSQQHYTKGGYVNISPETQKHMSHDRTNHVNGQIYNASYFCSQLTSIM